MCSSRRRINDGLLRSTSSFVKILKMLAFPPFFFRVPTLPFLALKPWICNGFHLQPLTSNVLLFFKFNLFQLW